MTVPRKPKHLTLEDQMCTCITILKSADKATMGLPRGCFEVYCKDCPAYYANVCVNCDTAYSYVDIADILLFIRNWLMENCTDEELLEALI